ncbi:MAG: AraC family transcriptional regulator [Clostridia bacterium]|nr:AraC family transcriptional regulator [Clostridia bacterium]
MRKNIEFKRLPIKGVEIKHCSYSEQSYKEHLHEELSIGYIEEGSTLVGFGGKDYLFTQGDGIIIPPYVSHICRPSDVDRWRFVMMYIDVSYIDCVNHHFKPRKLSAVELARFNDFLACLAEKHTDFELENALVELLVECMLNDGRSVTFTRNRALEDIYNYIKCNYLESITLESLERTFNINKFSIIRGFKSLYNTTPSSFQLQLKVSYSKGLLARGMNIVDACHEAGFYDQAHFTREFKKAHGKTPLQYQKDIVK